MSSILDDVIKLRNNKLILVTTYEEKERDFVEKLLQLRKKRMELLNSIKEDDKYIEKVLTPTDS